MFFRIVRTTYGAVRRFSAEAVASKSLAPQGSSVTSTSNSSGGGDTLGRRLLSLVYTKRSAVITIRKWKEEGHYVRKYELNRIVRELRRLKRYKHALEVCEWMRIQEDIKLLSGDYAVHLDLIAKIRGVNSAEKFFEDMPDKMRDHMTCSALLHTYVQHKMCNEAEALMEKMSECGFLKYPLPYNHMLSLYISIGRFEKVPGLIEELKKKMSPDVVTYNLWLTACASQNEVETAEKVFLEMKKAKVVADWVTYSALASIYMKNSRKDKAASTLKEMEKRISKKDRVGFPSLISLYTSLENKGEIRRIWQKMKSLFRKLNDAKYTSMISSLVKLGELEEAMNIYEEWENVSVTKDTRISNLLLSAYVNRDEMETAENFCGRMIKKGIPPSYTTWELMTWGYVKQRDTEKVINCFKKAVDSVKHWKFDTKMVLAVSRMLEENGNIEGAEQLLVILRSAGHVNTEIYNSLLRTYEKAGRMPLIVAERMKKDNVMLDEETQRLIQVTSKLCVGDVPACFS